MHGFGLHGLLCVRLSHGLVVGCSGNTVAVGLRAVDDPFGGYSVRLRWLNTLRIMEHIFLRVSVTLMDIPSGQALLLALLGSGIAYLIYLGREESK